MTKGAPPFEKKIRPHSQPLVLAPLAKKGIKMFSLFHSFLLSTIFFLNCRYGE